MTKWPLVTAAMLALPLVACQVAIPPAAPEQGGTSAIVDVTVIPLDTERTLPHHTILVKNGRIVAVGPNNAVAVPAGSRVIEGAGKFVMPGLADMHVHLAREEDLALYLAHGVTLVRNMWGAPIHLTWREKIKRGEMVGPTIVTAGPILDGDPPVHDGSLILKEPKDVDFAIALHKKKGYNFLKFYSRLPAPLFEKLLAAAKAAGLPTAGHVPREEGLAKTLAQGPNSIEHLTGFLDAVQKGETPKPPKKIDGSDESKLPALLQGVKAHNVFSCPTLGVLEDLPPSAVRARLLEPDMRYVPPYVKATWQPWGTPSEAEVRSYKRTTAFHFKVVAGLRDVGAPILVGTDTGNPLIVPGTSLFDELRRLVLAGLSPYEALTAATRGAAEFLHLEADRGTIAEGRLADIVLLGENPLVDIKNVALIKGLMQGETFYTEADLAVMLEHVADVYKNGKEAIGHLKEIPSPLPDLFSPASSSLTAPKRELDVTFQVTWKGIPFGGERLVVERSAEGETRIFSALYDPYKGQQIAVQIGSGPSGNGERIVLDSDGANGLGKALLFRSGGNVKMRGTLLSGAAFEQEVRVAPTGLLEVDPSIAGMVLLGRRVSTLPVGQTMQLEGAKLAVGSKAELTETSWAITRDADIATQAYGALTPARHFILTPKEGKPEALWLDELGLPLAWELTAFGDTLRYERVAPKAQN